MLISVVTPVFNCRQTLVESIESSLSMLVEAGCEGEIIVVDDGSTDGSIEGLDAYFSREQPPFTLHVVRFSENRGVTAAKQCGARRASGRWIAFMDADDRFLAGAGQKLCEVLNGGGHEFPLVFFRSVDKDSGELVGPGQTHDVVLRVSDFLCAGTPGECLPVVRRSAILDCPYDEDLRGFEGLAYARIIKKHGQALVSHRALRAYSRSDGQLRLSSKAGVRRRGCLLARGYVRLIAGFWRDYGIRISSPLTRAAYHAVNCITTSLSPER